MPNPLKGWRHRRKRPLPDKKTRIIPLHEAPFLNEETGLYKVIFSRKVTSGTKALNLVGMWFSWEGQSFYVVGQETISDPLVTRELDYKHRKDGCTRMYIRATLEKEDDDLFALLKGIRKP